MIKLHSTVLGKGKSLIILHGFLGMSDNWKTIGGKFTEIGYEVHLLDQRNHGRSPHTSEMNYKLLAEDVRDYCQTHNLKNSILLGHSMGGKAAMYAASEYPELFEKLVVVDIAPKYYSPHHQQILDGLSALDEKKFTSRGDAEDFLAGYIEDKSTRLFLLKNLYWKTKKHLALRLNLEVLKNSSEEIGAALPADFRFVKPTLFVKGENSSYIQSDDETLISLHFPNVQIVEISNSGHWVHAENVSEFYKKVKNFL